MGCSDVWNISLPVVWFFRTEQFVFTALPKMNKHLLCCDIVSILGCVRVVQTVAASQDVNHMARHLPKPQLRETPVVSHCNAAAPLRPW